jgi:hypothetical protein
MAMLNVKGRSDDNCSNNDNWRGGTVPTGPNDVSFDALDWRYTGNVNQYLRSLV